MQYIYIYIYVYIYICTHLPVNVTVRLPHPRSGDSQHPLLKSKPATMTQSAQTTIPPYQPKGQRD